MKPAMLTGHLDVVPIANPDAWEVDPFEAQIHNGFVYGRGALDDKVQMLWEEGEGGGKERGWGGVGRIKVHVTADAECNADPQRRMC